MSARWSGPAVMTLAVLTVLEVATFVEVVRTIGVLWSVVLLVLSSSVGAWLVRREIVRNRARLRVFADREQPLGPAVSDTVVRVVGVVLLALPGFFTAALGLVLLLPPSRLLVRRLVERSAEKHGGASAADDLFGPRRVRVRNDEAGTAIEGEVV